jgi:hypothetical protein
MTFSRLLTVAIPAAALLLISTPAPAQTVEQDPRLDPKPCVDQVQARLAEHNIQWEQVEDTAEFFRTDPTQDRQTGIHAWIRPPQCEEGWLVMDMAPSCAVRSIWTTGGCTLPGVASF